MRLLTVPFRFGPSKVHPLFSGIIYYISVPYESLTDHDRDILLTKREQAPGQTGQHHERLLDPPDQADG